MQEPKFDFDDILIVPSVTTKISSRYKDIELPEELPLFAAPMDTVVDLDNWKTFIDKGINVCLPRTISTKEVYMRATQFPTIRFQNPEIGYHKKMMFPSIGLGDYQDLCHIRPDILESFDNILIDVANGHMEQIIKACWHIKEYNSDIKIMVGNIGNPETYRWYANAGVVDYIRVGIGNGGGCLTTKQSGVGYPMASLIKETYRVKQNMMLNAFSGTYPAIVADGGMKDYVDIIKALGLGADYVMVGSIFNKALESCAPSYRNGKIIDAKKAEKLFLEGVEITKHFRGMSTKGAQKAMGKSTVKTSEGVERVRKVEYTLEAWVENFNHYLRNAMSYAGARTLDSFIGKAEICQITRNAYDRFNK
jgi:IMP dehydrogenase/GMP reductase